MEVGMTMNEEKAAVLALAQGPVDVVTEGEALPRPTRMGLGQRLVVVLLLSMVQIPPGLGIYSYLTGASVSLLSCRSEAREIEPQRGESEPPLMLEFGKPHTLVVPERICVSLGITQGAGTPW